MYPFRKKAILYGEELLATRPTLKLEDHPLTGVRLCNTFAATLHTAGRSSIHLRTRHAVVTWSHLSWTTTTTNHNFDKNHSISIQTLDVLSCDYHAALIHKEVKIHDFSSLKVEQSVTVLFCSTRFFRRTVVVCYLDLSQRMA
jgi:hypothetical protein